MTVAGYVVQASIGSHLDEDTRARLSLYRQPMFVLRASSPDCFTAMPFHFVHSTHTLLSLPLSETAALAEATLHPLRRSLLHLAAIFSQPTWSARSRATSGPSPGSTFTPQGRCWCREVGTGVLCFDVSMDVCVCFSPLCASTLSGF